MAEAGEGLIESRAGGGLELAVRVVNDRTSFVSLPRDVLASLTARSPALPLPLALTPVERWLKRRGETAGPTTPKPAFVAWAGAASDGFGVVDVPAATADCLRLRDGCVVRVTGRAASPHATAVQLSPESEADWGLVVEHAGEIERRLLTQVGVVAEGQCFPFWLKDSGGDGGPLRLVATRVSPSSPGGVARLGLNTELHIAPWTPAVAPGATAAAAVAAGGARDADADSDADAEEKSLRNAVHHANGVVWEAVSPPPPPPPRAVMRVQTARSVVVAWPRRMAAMPADEGEITAAPTSFAFVSKAALERGSAMKGPRDGDFVVVAPRRRRGGRFVSHRDRSRRRRERIRDLRRQRRPVSRAEGFPRRHPGRSSRDDQDERRRGAAAVAAAVAAAAAVGTHAAAAAAAAGTAGCELWNRARAV